MLLNSWPWLHCWKPTMQFALMVCWFGCVSKMKWKWRKKRPENDLSSTKTDAVTTTCKTKYINYLWFFVWRWAWITTKTNKQSTAHRTDSRLRPHFDVKTSQCKSVNQIQIVLKHIINAQTVQSPCLFFSLCNVLQKDQKKRWKKEPSSKSWWCLTILMGFMRYVKVFLLVCSLNRYFHFTLLRTNKVLFIGMEINWKENENVLIKKPYWHCSINSNLISKVFDHKKKYRTFT